MPDIKYTSDDGFRYYFDLVKELNYRDLFLSPTIFSFLKTIGEEQANFRYVANKWSIKQVVGHITDHERIKMYRAFLLSRGQQEQLWGYDQIALVENSRFDELTFQQLVNDFKSVRNASLSFIDTLSERQLKLTGFAKNVEISLEEFLKSIIGHETHHLNIIKAYYLS